MVDFIFSYPFIVVAIFSLVILFIINIFYKYLVNQNEAKAIKQTVKEMKDQMKAAQKEGKKDEATKLMGDMLKQQNRLMRMSMKPMIVSFIIVIIFLPMIGGLFVHAPKIENGSGNLTLNENTYAIQTTNSTVSMSSGSFSFSCEGECRQAIGGQTFLIKPEKDKLLVEQIIVLMPFSLPLVGDDLGWLACYIIISVPAMFIMRKAMKINV